MLYEKEPKKQKIEKESTFYLEMSTFSETTTAIITGVTSLQEQYLSLQERVIELETSLDAANLEVDQLRKENNRLRHRPTGVKVSGSVHVEETRNNNNKNNRRNNKKRDNVPDFNDIPPELLSQLKAFLMKDL